MRREKWFEKAERSKMELTLISSGLPIELPPTLRPLDIRVKALMAGRSSSGAPT